MRASPQSQAFDTGQQSTQYFSASVAKTRLLKGGLCMKSTLPVFALALTVLCLTAGDKPPQVTYVDHDRVAAALAKGGGLATGSNYSVGALHRSFSSNAEIHERQTDIYYVA